MASKDEDTVIDEGTYRERLAMAQKTTAERAAQGFKDYATQVYLYFAGLVDAGFTRDEALILTKSFQETFLASVFPAKS